MTLTQEMESLEAARRAREQEKLKALVGRPVENRGADGDPGGKNKKGKGWKGGSKGRGDDYSRGKGDGKKDDRGGWQKEKKEK